MTQGLQDETNISKFIFEYWRDLKREKYLQRKWIQSAPIFFTGT